MILLGGCTKFEWREERALQKGMWQTHSSCSRKVLRVGNCRRLNNKFSYLFQEFSFLNWLRTSSNWRWHFALQNKGFSENKMLFSISMFKYCFSIKVKHCLFLGVLLPINQLVLLGVWLDQTCLKEWDSSSSFSWSSVWISAFHTVRAGWVNIFRTIRCTSNHSIMRS